MSKRALSITLSTILVAIWAKPSSATDDLVSVAQKTSVIANANVASNTTLLVKPRPENPISTTFTYYRSNNGDNSRDSHLFFGRILGAQLTAFDWGNLGISAEIGGGTHNSTTDAFPLVYGLSGGVKIVAVAAGKTTDGSAFVGKSESRVLGDSVPRLHDERSPIDGGFWFRFHNAWGARLHPITSNEIQEKNRMYATTIFATVGLNSDVALGVVLSHHYYDSAKLSATTTLLSWADLDWATLTLPGRPSNSGRAALTWHVSNVDDWITGYRLSKTEELDSLSHTWDLGWTHGFSQKTYARLQYELGLTENIVRSGLQLSLVFGL